MYFTAEWYKGDPERLLIMVVAMATILSVATGAALAQDVVKVSPETHVVLLENAEVRVLSVLIKPGEKVAIHSHPRNVVYYLSDAGYGSRFRTAKSKTALSRQVWQFGATELFTLSRT